MKLKALVSVSFVFVLFVLAGVISTSAQEATPSPTPKASPTPRLEDQEVVIETELVNISVRVVDRNNRPINNLPQSDFKIYEDGVLQEIGFFSKSEVPTNYSLLVDNSAWGFYLNFDLVPFTVGLEIGRCVANRVLMAEFDRYSLEDLVHFDVARGIERLSTRHRRQLIEEGLALHSDLAGSVPRVDDADRVRHHVRLFHQATHLTKVVTG